jgi:hypothetical protein
VTRTAYFHVFSFFTETLFSALLHSALHYTSPKQKPMCADSYLKVERISPPPRAESQSHLGFSTVDADIKSSPDFGRLAIHIDMGELSYMHQLSAHSRGELPVENNLPERGIPPTSPAPVGCSTPEAAAYSTVSPVFLYKVHG